MKLTIVATVLLLMPAIVAYNPFKGSHRAAAAIKGKLVILHTDLRSILTDLQSK
jgi:hypothetical protein